MHDILGPLIGIHYQDRSTLRGPCRFPVFEAQTHQPVACSTWIEAKLWIIEDPNKPSCAGRSSQTQPPWTAVTIRNPFLESQLGESKPIASVNPLVHHRLQTRASEDPHPVGATSASTITVPLGNSPAGKAKRPSFPIRPAVLELLANTRPLGRPHTYPHPDIL